MTTGSDIRTLLRWAREAEDAGFDGVMIGEHVVLGPDAGAAGRMSDPREAALPGNQDPATPWPNSLALLSSIAALTERVRLVAAGVLAPLRHPLLLAKELATVDLLSEGRLVVLPTVSWSRDEYAALNVPFRQRGELLDEHLAAWQAAWHGSPASFDGRHYNFRDVFVQPTPYRTGGPPLWFGGSRLHRNVRSRIVRYGCGLHPLKLPSMRELQLLNDELTAAGRNLNELELVGGVPVTFPDSRSPPNLDRALESVPFQLDYGFHTISIKPSQFIDDPNEVGKFCKEVVRKLSTLVS